MQLVHVMGMLAEAMSAIRCEQEALVWNPDPGVNSSQASCKFAPSAGVLAAGPTSLSPQADEWLSHGYPTP